jgi:hypothetical protein
MYQVIQEIPGWEIQPHKVILNLASEDYQLIEKDFEKSCSVSLEIQIVDDLGPAKKIDTNFTSSGTFASCHHR